MTMDETRTASHWRAWNKGTLVGQKAPFKLQEIWAIRIRLQMQGQLRELALFDLGIDSKLRACFRECRLARVGLLRPNDLRPGTAARRSAAPFTRG
jgi:hypothetical protein